MLTDGSDTGSSELTAESADLAFESLLSLEEDSQDEKSPPTNEPPQSGKSETDEEEEGSPEPPKSEKDESEDAEESETDVDQPPTYKVKVAGEEVEVTVDELIKGYSRTSDYTRKTQEIAERRKQLDAEIPAVRAEREKVAEYLTQLEQALAETQYEEPDWAKLQKEQPDEFPRVWAEWHEREKSMKKIRDERDQAVTAVMADRAAQKQEVLRTEKVKLLEAIPEWKDAKVAKTEGRKIAEFALELGYPAEEIQNVTDHRALVLLRDAMRYREMMKKTPDVKRKIERVKAATPGSSGASERPPVTKLSRAEERLAKTGSREDADAAFEAMFAAQREN